MTDNSPQQYGPSTIALHWLMFILIVAVYSCIELRELYPKGSDTRNAFKQWHFMLGLSVFALVWFRLCARVLRATPAITPPLANWQRRLSRSVQLLLYVLMMGMPISGWLILSGEGKAVPFFGLTLPALMAENKDLAEQLEEFHELAGQLGYALIALHTLAALLHHYLWKDNTLIRMLPGRR